MGGGGGGRGGCGQEVQLGHEFFESAHLVLMVSALSGLCLFDRVLTKLCLCEVSMISTPKKQTSSLSGW